MKEREKYKLKKKKKGLKGNILEMHVFFGWGKRQKCSNIMLYDTFNINEMKKETL